MQCPHCQTELSVHPATRCLDAWAAEVVGYGRLKRETRGPDTWWEFPDGRHAYVPDYSTSVDAAMKLVEDCHSFNLQTGATRQWFAIVRLSEKDKRAGIAREPAAALAITKAAIAAKGETK